MYDPTISLGDIIQAITLVVVLGGAFLHFSGRLVKLETKVALIMEYFGLKPRDDKGGTK